MALGTPPASPNFNAPRYAAGDPADYFDQTNAVTDAFDAQAAKRGAIVDADLASGANISKAKLAPLDVLDSDVDPSAAIQESKLALASDAAPGTASRRTLGTGAQQAAAGNDSRFGGSVPVAGIVPYAGTGDPAGGTWIIADGRLIDRTVYAAFFAAVGHAYNGGVDPGSNKVKIPDKRGKHSIGAINMGTGAGPSDNAHAQYSRGQVGGEVVDTLTSAQIPAHAHPISDPGHGHGVSDSGHNHAASDQGAFPYIPVGNGSFGGPYGFTAGGAAQAVDTQSSQVGWTSHVGTGATGVSIQNRVTGISVQNNTGGGGSHNNVGPYEADSYIVRVA